MPPHKPEWNEGSSELQKLREEVKNLNDIVNQQGEKIHHFRKTLGNVGALLMQADDKMREMEQEPKESYEEQKQSFEWVQFLIYKARKVIAK